jgi:hypothetical protein
VGVVIKEIQRNSNEIIRVEVSEFKGHELINIRIWYSSIDQNTGELTYKPTQKGVALNIEHFAELKDGILRLENYITDKAKGSQPEQFEEAITLDVQEDEIGEDERK